jgi:hypothetical protein
MKTIKVKDLMAVSGKGGLFRFLAQARNGVVVESLVEKRRSVVPPTARVSALEDISIFTENEDIPLADVLMKIYEKEEGGSGINPKSGNDELKRYFLEVLPEYDEERVYVSDIKKVVTWYNLLHELKLLEVIDKEEDTEDNADEKSDSGEASESGKSESKKAQGTGTKKGAGDK